MTLQISAAMSFQTSNLTRTRAGSEVVYPFGTSLRKLKAETAQQKMYNNTAESHTMTYWHTLSNV